MEQLNLSTENKFAIAATKASADIDRLLLPDVHEINPADFKRLGAKMGKLATSIYDSLQSEYGVKLPSLVAACVKLAWLPVLMDIEYQSRGWKLEDEESVPLDADNYVRSKGWMWLLYNFTNAVNELPAPVLNKMLLQRGLGDFAFKTMLEIMAVYLFSVASCELGRDQPECALDWIHEASDALLLAEVKGFQQWHAENGQADEVSAASKLAILGADARHAENRSMKADAFRWCDVNMEKFTSIDSAAEAIAGKVIPVKFRTAHSYITQWRRLRSASKV
jgi:hypothetical protein